MEQRLKVSVIIPIYNVEKYISACVDSVLNQTYKNIEIILVNDGSQDKSSDICDEYASTFSSIKVIHKENGGLSDARNRGLESATGDYISFLDGDDFWDDTEALSKMVERLMLTRADVLNYSFKKYYEDTDEKILYFANVSEMPLEFTGKEQQLKYLSEQNLYISSACTKLIKTSLFDERLLFERGVYSEDVEWSAKLLQKAKTMDFVCMNFYCYRQRRDSISHTVNDKKSNDLCNHIEKCMQMYNEATGAEKDALGTYVAYQFGTYFIVQSQTERQQKECIERLGKYVHILKNHKKNKKLMILNWSCWLIGYKNVCKAIRYVYRLKRK